MRTILEKLFTFDHGKTQHSTSPKSTPPDEGESYRFPLAVSPNTRVSRHAEGLTLLHIPSGQIFVCNYTAARIWQGAVEGRCLDELSDEMSRQYRIAREIAQSDTRAIVDQMIRHGLIIRKEV